MAPAEMPHAHAYQMLAYCTALGLDTGWLAYAAGGAPPVTHIIRNASTKIVVAGVDLDLPPAGVLASVGALAERIARRALP